jgi:DNA-binding HxlR family transcriptional regulator
MTTKRSLCPISCTLDILGDKWTLLVVRDLFAGRTHFKDFLRSPEKIATNVLADRLERLVDGGIVESSPSPDRVGAQAYGLTPKGRALYPVLVALRDWGLNHIEGTEVHIRVPKSGSKKQSK